MRRVVAKQNCGIVAGICGIAWELLKEGGEPMIQGLLVLLFTAWQSGTIPSDSKRDPLTSF